MKRYDAIGVPLAVTVHHLKNDLESRQAKHTELKQRRFYCPGVPFREGNEPPPWPLNDFSGTDLPSSSLPAEPRAACRLRGFFDFDPGAGEATESSSAGLRKA